MSGLWRSVAAMIALLVAAFLGYRLLFGKPVERLVVVEARGTVEVADALGVAARAAVGRSVGPRERLRSGPDGSAVLALEDGSGLSAARIALAPATSVQVVAVDEDGVRIALERGRVQATVRPGAGRVDVAAGERSIVAEDADFAVARGDDGAFGAEVTRGEVEVRGVEDVARIEARSRLLAVDGAPPLVAPASEALLLHVQPLEAARTRAPTARLAGRTAPRADVVVRDADGHEVARGRSDVDGAFAVEVALVEGPNTVRVEARDVLGNVRLESVTVTRDTTAPSFGVEVRY